MCMSVVNGVCFLVVIFSSIEPFSLRIKGPSSFRLTILLFCVFFIVKCFDCLVIDVDCFFSLVINQSMYVKQRTAESTGRTELKFGTCVALREDFWKFLP